VAEQDWADFDIVVVDDGSTDAEAVARVVDGVENAWLLRRPGEGSGPARNHGVWAAAAPLIAFTDDDCCPERGWLTALVARLDGGADVVAGETVSVPNDSLGEASQLAANAFLRTSVEHPSFFGPSSNLACRREVVLRVPFAANNELGSGEDRDWFARVSADGARVIFEPGAVVEHRQELDLPRLWEKHIRYGRAAYRFRREHARARVEPPSFYAGLLRKGFAAGPRVGAALCLVQIATGTGYVLEATRRT